MIRITAFFWMIFCIVLGTMYFTGAWVPNAAMMAFFIVWFMISGVIDFLKACMSND